MADRIPGWEAQDGTPETVMIEGSAIEDAETRRAAKETFDTIARWFGTSVYQVPPRDPIAATVTSTWTLTHTNGGTIFGGTQITLEGVGGERRGFEVVEDVVIPFGNAATAGGEVELVAVEPGADDNGLSVDPQPEEILDDLDSIAIVGVTAGGADGETELEYLNRFTRRQRLTSPHLVRPEDFEAFARDWEDELYGTPVGRALAFDRYDPADGTEGDGNEGIVTLVVQDVAGLPLSTGEKTALKAAMEALLWTGSVVHIADAEYTVVTITFTATSYDGFDPAVVEAEAEAAALAAITPAAHGLPPFGDVPLWVNEPAIRRNEIIRVIENVRGLKDLTALTINGSSTADLTLATTNAHPAGLPDVSSTVTGTVT